MSTLALDIGGTKIAAAVVDGASVLGARRVPTPSRRGPAAVVAAASALVGEVARDAGHDQLGQLRLGVATCGVVHPDDGSIAFATDSIDDWRGTRLRDELLASTGVADVVVVNDVQAHTWGEYVHGVGADARSMLLLGVGTGIGGGIVVDGTLVRGFGGVAGHVGHVESLLARGVTCPCGQPEHVEAIASGSGIERHFTRRTGRHLTGAEIDRLVGSGDALADDARVVMQTAGDALGRAIGGLLNALDPGLVVLAGSVARAGSHWWDAVAEGIERTALPVVAGTEVRRASLQQPALVGAASLANEEA